ncbi:hypothetical protein PMAYCL1PPCAC_00239, partial [Pristionchus mayeri]
MDATSTVMISFLIILAFAFFSLGLFALCRLCCLLGSNEKKLKNNGRKMGRRLLISCDLSPPGFRPRLSSPIYAITTDTGGGKKSRSFYGSHSPVPDQREYLDVSTVRESRRATLSPSSTRERSTSRGRISVLHECPFASAPPLDDPSQYSPVKEVFMDVPPQLRRTDRY